MQVAYLQPGSSVMHKRIIVPFRVHLNTRGNVPLSSSRRNDLFLDPGAGNTSVGMSWKFGNMQLLFGLGLGRGGSLFVIRSPKAEVCAPDITGCVRFRVQGSLKTLDQHSVLRGLG